jgi:hypothetical protein
VGCPHKLLGDRHLAILQLRPVKRPIGWIAAPVVFPGISLA